MRKCTVEIFLIKANNKYVEITDTIRITPAQIIRMLLAFVFLIVVIWFVGKHKTELTQTLEAVRSGNWFWLIVAGLTMVLFFMVAAQYYSRGLRIVGIPITPRATLPILIGAQTVGIVTPSEFLACQTLFAYWAKRQGQSLTQTVIGVFIAQIAELFSFLVILALGLSFLIANHTIEHFEIIAAYILFVVSLAIIGLMMTVVLYPHLVTGIITRWQKLWNRFNRWLTLPLRIRKSWITNLSEEIHEASAAVRANPHQFWSVLGLALLGHILRIICLLCIFAAFGVPTVVWHSVTSYMVGTVVWMLSPLPQGIGLVEGAYGLAFVSLGIAASTATTLALTYRAFVFWLPFIAGIFTLRQLRKPVVEIE